MYELVILYEMVIRKYLNTLMYKRSIMKKINDLKINDKVQKEMSSSSINGFLEFTNIDLKVVDSIPTESIDIIKSSSVDYSGFIENKDILILEFHTGKPNDNLSVKLLRYAASFFLKHGVWVFVYAICTDPVDGNKVHFRWGEENIFTYGVISLKHIKGREALNSIKNKVENNIRLSSKDIVCLKMILYTSFNEKPQDIMLETCKITNEAPDLTQDELDEIKKIQELTTLKFIDEEYHQDITRVIEMKNSLFYNDIMKERERTEKRTEERTKVSVIRNALPRMPISEIAELCELTVFQVEDLIKKYKIRP